MKKSFNCIFTICRACIFCHFCQNNCFFILLSWLPTYFHDNFPEAKSWIFNVVPWLLMVPGIGLASLVSNYFHHKGYSTGATRKISEAICMVTEALCLISIGKWSLHTTLFEIFNFCPKIQLLFPEKIVDFLGGEKLVKMLWSWTF